MLNKRGQLTIFIILAVLVVAGVALFFILKPQISTSEVSAVDNPEAYIQECVEEDLNDIVTELSLRGGSLEPEHYYLYDNEELQYLCYTNSYFELCKMQVPFLRDNIEEEIKEAINPTITACFNSLEESYERKNYQTTLKKGDLDVTLLPKRIVVQVNNSLFASKGSDSKSYDQFNIVSNNNLYELVSIAQNIVEWEAKAGDVEVTFYMNIYHDLKVEKEYQSDETTVYILSDKNNGDKFQFASRSLAFPPL